MTSTVSIAQHADAELRPNPGRVIARLFMPGEEPPRGRSRAAAVADRVRALPEDEIADLAVALITDFADRHRGYPAMLAEHAAMVSPQLPTAVPMTSARALVLGAAFTAEYAVEAAALCNPSAVPHHDQSGLEPDQVRVAVSLRGIGEGHLSSLGFCTAVVGPGPSWAFEPRALPAVAGSSTLGHWRREHLSAVLSDQGRIDALASGVLAVLPELFTGEDLQEALALAPQDLLVRPGGAGTVDLLRQLVASAYEVEFPADVALSQRVLLPSAAEESNGMEDARFVRFVDDDGTVDYRATYTAYDGRQIASRLLRSPDLRVFSAQRLAGPAARNKGMALFPRRIDGKHWSLCRSDGENTYLATSSDGLLWSEPIALQAPEKSWELLQVGNCGPPLETEHGWLVLTHGVGPMRTYSIGAMLLDLADPTVILRRLDRPVLHGSAAERDGYVPNVVYSCGGTVHDGRLWLPYGIGDARIGVAWAPVEELLDAMTPIT